MRLALWVLLAVGSPVWAQDSAPVKAMEGALLKGSGPEAQQALGASATERLSAADKEYVTCVRARLSTAPRIDESLVPLASKVLLAYQTYWYGSIKDPGSRSQNEEDLRKALSSQLDLAKSADFSAIEPVLEKKLASEGFFVLTGLTPPLHELMLWKKQSTKNFSVQLPEQKFDSRVVMLDGFKSLGWAAWATCDRRSTGGWATDTTLYAVMPRYVGGISSNQFLAVLLTHETQHFADKNTFKELKPWGLEYRAKLAELWAADAAVSRDRLNKFMSSQSADKDLAHPYANAQLISNLTRALGASPQEVGVEILHNASLQLLRQDTQSRSGNGR